MNNRQRKQRKQKRILPSALHIRYALVTDRPSVALEDKALLCALQCGLCPETEDGYDVSVFRKFWRRFAPMIDRWSQENLGCAVK